MFKVMKLKRENYSHCVLIQSQESLHSMKVDLERFIARENIEGRVLLDTLFHAGNTYDRFYEIEIKHEKVNWSMLKVVSVEKQSEIRKKVGRFLMNNPQLVESSTLTNIQKRLLSAGIGI
ncbi:hypothetical protein GXP75_18945 [Bacillus sp. HU-1818]|uniref:type II toxin-antitoxin system RnlB family antitoxin n=1 Tax=Bacillus sp. HU-1818 TaxID=2704469 RepID=UPI001F5C2110|nr:type II toxin-antitoxin system RnlB family antitoxin [Bacillus sp. HU-1818]MCI3197705.1 hypothetical protein [Bacillus sp. HU-1818]